MSKCVTVFKSHEARTASRDQEALGDPNINLETQIITLASTIHIKSDDWLNTLVKNEPMFVVCATSREEDYDSLLYKPWTGEELMYSQLTIKKDSSISLYHPWTNYTFLYSQIDKEVSISNQYLVLSPGLVMTNILRAQGKDEPVQSTTYQLVIKHIQCEEYRITTESSPKQRQTRIRFNEVNSNTQSTVSFKKKLTPGAKRRSTVDSKKQSAPDAMRRSTVNSKKQNTPGTKRESTVNSKKQSTPVAKTQSIFYSKTHKPKNNAVQSKMGLTPVSSERQSTAISKMRIAKVDSKADASSFSSKTRPTAIEANVQSTNDSIKKGPHTCSICQRNFVSIHNLQNHLFLHTGSFQYHCSTCGRGCASRGRLHSHEKIHMTKRDFKCDQCDKTFLNKTVLKEHSRKHSRERPFHCLLCNERFLYASNLHAHVITHTGERTHSCDFCKRMFLTASSAQLHRQIHERKNSYKCPDCPRMFLSKGGMNYHKEVAHTAELQVQCDVCSKWFYSQLAFKMHRKVQCGERTVPCPICGKLFTTHRLLQRHQVIHDLVRPYTCDVCGHGFNQINGLKLHLSVHRPLTDRPNTCDICGQSFRRKDVLYNHRRLHNKNFRYHCDTCGKKFHLKYYLLQHTRIHTGVKDHQCDTCNKVFSLRSNLKKHQVGVHDSQEPVHCVLCDKVFKNKTSLHRHISKHVKIEKNICEVQDQEHRVRHSEQLHLTNSLQAAQIEGGEDQTGTHSPAALVHPHPSGPGTLSITEQARPQTCPVWYAERRQCCLNASLVGGKRDRLRLFEVKRSFLT
uniref:(California timema) hypothetical protein n=1 Tax=Timema californicum TaxID=61474 RepID=A0A7R9P3K4_TIMCA|nr:unnamed protein product [Timema californicum]